MREKLRGNIYFFDIDGTLFEYRYKDRLYFGECIELGH